MQLYTLNDKKELELRWAKIKQMLERQNADACLISTPINLLYVSGRVISGFAYVPAEGEPQFFVRRPVNLQGENLHFIRKPEQISELLLAQGIAFPKVLMLEADELSYNEYLRLQAVFGLDKCLNASHLLRVVRSVKTDLELAKLKASAKLQSEVLANVPNLYRAGMTDKDLAIEVEKAIRMAGGMPVLRIYGATMEGGLCCVWAGDNAAAPSPYDFSLGGEGQEAFPMGENGTHLTAGMSAMIDSGLNANGYLSDQTRTYSIGKLPQKAYDIHQVSLEIQDKLMQICKPGAVCEHIYQASLQIVEKHGLSDYFMGHAQQAKFVGHGVGLVVNELPVLCDRNQTLLEPNMCLAIEPKFIVPGVGAVGTENTYIVRESGLEKITSAPEEIISLID